MRNSKISRHRDAQTTIGASYRISPTTVGRIIEETCSVLWHTLLEQGYLHIPSDINDWRKIAMDFEQRWNFLHALGALDCKHVVMQAPARSGSTFFNYKKIHSIVLLAVCNAQYQFTLVDIGDTSRQADGSVYSNNYLGRAIENGLLNFPAAEPLHNHPGKKFPYVFLADDAFGLKTNLMNPTQTSTCPLMRGSLITDFQELAGLLKMLLALQLPGLECFTDPSLQRRRRLFSSRKLLLHYITS